MGADTKIGTLDPTKQEKKNEKNQNMNWNKSIEWNIIAIPIINTIVRHFFDFANISISFTLCKQSVGVSPWFLDFFQISSTPIYSQAIYFFDSAKFARYLYICLHLSCAVCDCGGAQIMWNFCAICAYNTYSVGPAQYFVVFLIELMPIKRFCILIKKIFVWIQGKHI